MSNSGHTSRAITTANKKMQEAWEQGQKLYQDLGGRSGYGSMKKRSGGNVSQADKMRKYRAMARRITQKELKTICKLCLQHGKPWGPTYLVTLSRLNSEADRRKLAEKALQDDWGLSELQHQVRRSIGPVRDSRVVGRKWRGDLTSEAAILDRISRLCVSWIRLNDLLEASSKLSNKEGLALLPEKLRERFTDVSERIANLERRIARRSDRVS